MRKVYFILTAIIVSLFLSSCSSAEREEDAAAETMEHLPILLEKKDSDGLK